MFLIFTIFNRSCEIHFWRFYYLVDEDECHHLVNKHIIIFKQNYYSIKITLKQVLVLGHRTKSEKMWVDNLGITKDMVLLNDIYKSTWTISPLKLINCWLNRCPQQKYREVNETFLKSNHPAVARTKPRLSSPFPIANPVLGSPSQVGLSGFLDPYSQNTNSRQVRHEEHAQEVVTSFNEYIIPIPDPRPEEGFTNVPSESPERYRDANIPLTPSC